MQSRWLNRVMVVAALLLGMMVQVDARKSTDMQHYIGISVGGGEANECQPGERMHALAGWGANMELGYHLQKGIWLFGIGVEGSEQGVQMQMPVFYDALPYQNEVYPQLNGGEYRYNYVNHIEKNRNIAVSLPIEVGVDLDPVYILAGIAPRYIISSPYSVSTDLYTSIAEVGYEVTTEEGQLQDFIDMGAYPLAHYQAEGKRVEPVMLVTKLEIGGYMPIKGKHRLRLGAYCQVGARLRGMKDNVSTYHQYENAYILGVSPYAWQDVVQHNVRWQPLVASNRDSQNPVNIEVGVRLSWLIRIRQTQACMCYPQYR